MTDNGLAALAAALQPYEMPDSWTPGMQMVVMAGNASEVAAAILDALDSAGWRLMARDKASPNERTIATLRAALDGLRDEVADSIYQGESGVWYSRVAGDVLAEAIATALATAKEAGG
jgi:hypothetical protein